MLVLPSRSNPERLDRLQDLAPSGPALWQDDRVPAGNLERKIFFASRSIIRSNISSRDGRSQHHGSLEDVKTIDGLAGFDEKGGR
jgi:hypothetical protein